MLRRRSILAASAALPAVFALSACGGRTVSQLQTDVETIATGLSGIATDLGAIPNIGISAGTMTQIQAELALIKSQAAQIGGAFAPGQVVVTDFVATVDELATLVRPFFAMAPAVAALITAAASLAQIVLQEAGGASTAARMALWNMPAPAARAVLRAPR